MPCSWGMSDAVSPSQATTTSAALTTAPPSISTRQASPSRVSATTGEWVRMRAPVAVAAAASAATHPAGSSSPSASTTAASGYQRAMRAGTSSGASRASTPASCSAEMVLSRSPASSSPASHNEPVRRT